MDWCSLTTELQRQIERIRGPQKVTFFSSTAATAATAAAAADQQRTGAGTTLEDGRGGGGRPRGVGYKAIHQAIR